jgi:peptidoglycan L-alanyl-D-glutamate endopeptidase CwlK
MSRFLTDLEPETLKLANAFLANCEAASVDVLVTCTLRTFAEQDALYAKGRTEAGMIVTNAKGGQSPHQYGMALDVVPLEHGKPIWQASDPIWAIVGVCGVNAGLEWGANFPGSFKDIPHFQRSNWKDHIGEHSA